MLTFPHQMKAKHMALFLVHSKPKSADHCSLPLPFFSAAYSLIQEAILLAKIKPPMGAKSPFSWLFNQPMEARHVPLYLEYSKLLWEALLPTFPPPLHPYPFGQLRSKKPRKWLPTKLIQWAPNTCLPSLVISATFMDQRARIFGACRSV